MKKPEWIDAPEWATHLIIKRVDPNKGEYHWALYEGGDDYRTGPAKSDLWFHPEAYDHVSKRPCGTGVAKP